MDQSLRSTEDRGPNIYVLEEQIKQLQRDVKDGFGRLEKQMGAILELYKAEIDDHEDRIRALEKSNWKWAGIASVVGALLGLLGSWLVRVTS